MQDIVIFNPETPVTYSIIAAIPDTGRIGLAVASRSIAAGFTQVHAVIKSGVLVRAGGASDACIRAVFKLIEVGVPPLTAIELSAIRDSSSSARQLALIDSTGRSAAWTHAMATPWSGFVEGQGFVASGVGLAGKNVVDAMADAFRADSDKEFDLRLLSALEAGAAAGGFAGGAAARSAALAVYGTGVHSEADLRVDLHEDAVAELRAIYDFHKPYEVFYKLRGDNPRETPPQEAFMATIKTASR
jgi:uncharacterized Ntn-hydrolase superfamily protein